MATPDSWTNGNVATSTYERANTEQTDPNSYDTNPAIAGTVSDAQNPVAAYGQALQAAYAPQFAQNQQALNANQAANGTLTSGAGNYGQQELTAQDNALIAQGEQPLIQQGYQNAFTANQDNASALNARQNALTGESFQNAETNTGLREQNDQYDASQKQANNQFNAGAGNAMLSQIQGETNQDALANASNSLQAQEFNSGQQQNAYLQALQEQYGILDSGLNSYNGTVGNGVGQQMNAYGTGVSNANQEAGALGQAAGDYFTGGLASGGGAIAGGGGGYYGATDYGYGDSGAG